MNSDSPLIYVIVWILLSRPMSWLVATRMNHIGENRRLIKYVQETSLWRLAFFGGVLLLSGSVLLIMLVAGLLEGTNSPFVIELANGPEDWTMKIGRYLGPPFLGAAIFHIFRQGFKGWVRRPKK